MGLPCPVQHPTHAFVKCDGSVAGGAGYSAIRRLSSVESELPVAYFKNPTTIRVVSSTSVFIIFSDTTSAGFSTVLCAMAADRAREVAALLD